MELFDTRGSPLRARSYCSNVNAVDNMRSKNYNWGMIFSSLNALLSTSKPKTQMSCMEQSLEWLICCLSANRKILLTFFCSEPKSSSRQVNAFAWLTFCMTRYQTMVVILCGPDVSHYDASRCNLVSNYLAIDLQQLQSFLQFAPQRNFPIYNMEGSTINFHDGIIGGKCI